jgi:hypothetical protein
LSEDPAGDGANWYVYGQNAPTVYADGNGRDALQAVKVIAQILVFFLGAMLMDMWAEAETAQYKLTKWIHETQSLIHSGINIATSDELLAMHRDLERNRQLLRRGKMIGRSQSLLKLLGYMMLVKAFLMDIDFGSDTSGLDIIFGNATISDVFWGK